MDKTVPTNSQLSVPKQIEEDDHLSVPREVRIRSDSLWRDIAVGGDRMLDEFQTVLNHAVSARLQPLGWSLTKQV